MTDIYDVLTEMIRRYGQIRSNRPLTEDEETQVCRWLAQEVKLRWPALSAQDQIELIEEYDPKTGERRTLPDVFYEYLNWPIDENTPFEQLVAKPETTKERHAPLLIEGGIRDVRRGFKAQGKVWMNYAHNILFVWSERKRWIEEANGGDDA